MSTPEDQPTLSHPRIAPDSTLDTADNASTVNASTVSASPLNSRRSAQVNAAEATTAADERTTSLPVAGDPSSSITAAWTSAGGQPSQTPREIGGYVIIEEIARGGMGVVYKAHQRGLNRLVALKMTLAGDFAGEQERERFRLEAEAAGGLDHPCIVPIYEVSQHEGRPFFSMGFVDGQSLKGLLSSGPLSPRRAAEIMRSVAQAVAYAHSRGVVHRDLKPANILMDSSGLPRITDFGLAKQVATNSELTTTGQILGTPSFMPPEQAQGKIDQVGPLADVYSLGATLFCLLTGRPPFQAASLMDTLMQVVNQEPVSPRALDSTIPRDVETICLKCLEKSPGRRYGNAQELVDDLERFLNDEPVRARPLSRIERTWRWCRRKPLAAGLVGAMALLIVFVSVGYWYRLQYANAARQLVLAEALKRVSDYYAGMSRAREHNSQLQSGSTWQTEKELAPIAPLIPNETERREFRALQADVRARFDLRKIGSLSIKFHVGCLAFSSDGKRLALGQRKHGAGFIVNIYDTEQIASAIANFNTNSEAIELPAPNASYTVSTLGTAFNQLLSGQTRYQDGAVSLAFSPDGRWLVVGSRFGKLTRWDTTQKNFAGITWPAGDRPIRRLMFSADGTSLFSWGGLVQHWDCTAQWKEIDAEKIAIDAAAIAPDARTMIGHVRQYDSTYLVNSDRTLAPTWPDACGFRPVAMTPDCRLVAGRDGQHLTVRTVRSGDPYQTFLPADDEIEIDLDSVNFVCQEQILVGRDDRRRLHFWHTATGRPAIQPIGSADDALRWTSSAARNWLILTDVESTDLLQIYEMRTPQVVRSFLQTGHPQAIDFTEDGQQLAVVATSPSSNVANFWTELTCHPLSADADPQRTHAQHRAHNKLLPPFAVDWQPQQQRIAWFAGLEGLIVSDLQPTATIHRLLQRTDRSDVPPITITPRENSGSPALTNLVLNDVQVIVEKEPTTRTVNARWSPDGRTLWSMIEDNKRLVAWDATSLQPVASWSNKLSEIATGLANICSFDVGAQFVVCGGDNGFITVLPAQAAAGDTRTLEPTKHFLGPGGPVLAVVVGSSRTNQSDSWVAIGTQTGKLQILSLPEGKLISELQSDHGSIATLAYNPHQQLLAAGGEDGYVRLIQLHGNHQGQLRMTLNPRCGAITQVKLSADGNYLAVLGRQSNAALVWNLALLEDAP